MLKIREDIRDEIVKAVINSVIPSNVGIPIANALNGLDKIVEKKDEPVKVTEAKKDK